MVGLGLTSKVSQFADMKIESGMISKYDYRSGQNNLEKVSTWSKRMFERPLSEVQKEQDFEVIISNDMKYLKQSIDTSQKKKILGLIVRSM